MPVTARVDQPLTSFLNEDAYVQYEREGYLKIGAVWDAIGINALCTRIDEIMLGKISYRDMLMQLDTESGAYGSLGSSSKEFKGSTLNYRKIQDLEKDPVYLRYMQAPIFRSITQRLIGTNISVFRAMFMNKPAKKGTLLPWHQDGGENWGLGIDPILTVWTALDDATKENGCVEVIPGSHKLGLLTAEGHTVNAQDVEKHCSGATKFIELKKGEVALLHNFLIHRSDVNKTDQSRRGFSVCYMDAATRLKKDDSKFPVIF